MSLFICAQRHPIAAIKHAARRPLIRICERHFIIVGVCRKRQFSGNTNGLLAAASEKTKHDFLSEYKDSFLTDSFPDFRFDHSKTNEKYLGKPVTVQGFLGKRKDLSEKLSFAQLTLAQGDGSEIQMVSRVEDNPAPGSATTSEDIHKGLKSIRSHSAVLITAVIVEKRQPRQKGAIMDKSKRFQMENLELVLQDITCLAAFPEDIIISDDVKFGPESRHLQLRFDLDLKNRLKFRDRILRQCREELNDFQEIETPILFKSTPEGAREFLVPTRRSGFAYALPQSPQQYKQILMASGIHRYFQIAKCFRDEDLRADRQPEFTQVDLEMAFSNGETVMERTEGFIRSLFRNNPCERGPASSFKKPFTRMTYHEAMNKHGSDKPDLRIPDDIQQIADIVPIGLVGMLTTLPNPVLDCWRLRLRQDPSATRAFVKEFMDSSEAIAFQQNPDGPPGIFIYDPRQPLNGLQAFGHEGTEALRELYVASNILTGARCASDVSELDDSASEPPSDPPSSEPFEEGDVIVVQARPSGRLSGGSTALGRLRIAMHRAAVLKGLIDQNEKEFCFLWVTDFPLFTPNNGTDPGQGGTAGFSATHHPFTAPKTAVDVDLLLTNPLEAIADHYDLVVNGVELGGGSRRIHNSEMQQFIMREVLKMSDERLKDFSHLFEVLRAGCPPHAGIALGLDRLIAVMLGVDSVRDVIAFPKSGKGEDLLVKSPSRMTREQQHTYHLNVVK